MNRDQVQPYFRHLMIERGYRDSSESPIGEFTPWIGARWAEFARHLGKPRADVTSTFYSDQFAEWLEARSLDLLAREFVEGAPHKPLSAEARY